MTGSILLNWTAVAVSLTNVILLLWLGLTVLLNAKQRVFGVWLASGGLLLGAVFFICHTAILGYVATFSVSDSNGWWRAGWIPLVVLPFTWYMVTLWHTGQWDETAIWPRTKRGWITVLGAGCAIQLAWLLMSQPLPSLVQLTRFDLTASPQFLGRPLFLFVYPAYIIVCVSLATVELIRNRQAPYVVSDPGRQRAHPWLTAVSVGLLSVTFMVTGVIVWITLATGRPSIAPDPAHLGTIAVLIDLVIATLITVATLLLGQAIIAFEALSNRKLPRIEFQRQWRTAIILATSYSAVVSVGLGLQLRPIYLLLLLTVLVALFFTLSGWHWYTLRQQYLSQLRPFLTSQHLYDHLLAISPAEIDLHTPFQALCENILHTEFAQLIALGPLAPLVPPLTFPRPHTPAVSLSQELIGRCGSPQVMYLPIQDSDMVQGAIPLWSERGLIGLFLLGRRNDGKLYTQEEIEVARITGERLVDTRASAEIAHRLMTLQRQRLVESRIIDRQTRRVLHDEVLPGLHTALLSLPNVPASGTVSELLTETHQQISRILHHLPADHSLNFEEEGLFETLRHMISLELSNWFDSVEWQIEPRAKKEVARLPAVSSSVLYYALREVIRNAAKHGRGSNEQQPLSLLICAQYRDCLAIIVEDNGVGLANSSSSTSNGQGLALHSTMLAIIGGELQMDSVPGSFTRITITLKPIFTETS